MSARRRSNRSVRQYAVSMPFVFMRARASFRIADAGRGCRTVGPARRLVSCVRVPAQAENCPQGGIRAGGRAGGQSNGSSLVNAMESMGCWFDGGGPLHTFPPVTPASDLRCAAICFLGSFSAASANASRNAGQGTPAFTPAAPAAGGRITQPVEAGAVGARRGCGSAEPLPPRTPGPATAHPSQCSGRVRPL